VSFYVAQCESLKNIFIYCKFKDKRLYKYIASNIKDTDIHNYYILYSKPIYRSEKI